MKICNIFKYQKSIANSWTIRSCWNKTIPGKVEGAIRGAKSKISGDLQICRSATFFTIFSGCSDYRARSESYHRHQRFIIMITNAVGSFVLRRRNAPKKGFRHSAECGRRKRVRTIIVVTSFRNWLIPHARHIPTITNTRWYRRRYDNSTNALTRVPTRTTIICTRNTVGRYGIRLEREKKKSSTTVLHKLNKNNNPPYPFYSAHNG